MTKYYTVFITARTPVPDVDTVKAAAKDFGGLTHFIGWHTLTHDAGFEAIITAKNIIEATEIVKENIHDDWQMEDLWLTEKIVLDHYKAKGELK